MAHTKRSPEFQQRINALKAGTQHMIDEELKKDLPACTAFWESILEILEKNTTDSPCIVKAAEDEPIFVLRGQDNTADELVTKWAEMVRTRQVNLTQGDAELERRLGTKWTDALMCAHEMRIYPIRRRPD